MLDDVVKWKSLSELSSYEGINEYHYKYLNSVFNKWTSKNIFSKAYSNMLQNEYFRLKHIRNNLIINQIIDCSFITNLYGVNSIATNPEYRKNWFSKISVVSDEKKIIIAVDFDETHLTKKNNSAFCHDLKIVRTTSDGWISIYHLIG